MNHKNSETILISIVVPVFNSAKELSQCLEGITEQARERTDVEVIVVDDASADDSAQVAAGFDVQVLQQDQNAGPGLTRNKGAEHASGELLVFIDADLLIAPGTIERFIRFLRENQDYAAIFGSYDDSPAAQTLVSQYRNLLHHFVHQTSPPEASHYFGALGGIRRSAFSAAGGFREREYILGIEDVELGYRLCEMDYRILLDRYLQGKHLKKWTLKSMIKTDVKMRAVPWARLLLERRILPKDFSLGWRNRVSTAATLGGGLFLLLSVKWPFLLVVVAAAAAGFLWGNAPFLRFLVRHKGKRFALGCLPLHFIYNLSCALSFLWVMMTSSFKRIVPWRHFRTLSGRANSRQ
jgi:glycosyltransferase involved in cell wall biosynthesis